MSELKAHTKAVIRVVVTGFVIMMILVIMGLTGNLPFGVILGVV